MEMGVAILALSFGIAAVVVAIAADVRTRRATRELARELVQLRERLLRAERQGGLGDVPHAGDAEGSRRVEALATRIDELEERLRRTVDRRGAPGGPRDDGTPREVSAQVVDALRGRGYHQVTVVDTRADGSVLVEAERDGVFAKGVARVTADGGVELESVSSVRAFP
ncbi:MAG: hypothetical protein QNJ98_15010 [Planctomycetota bacterium]|nr:hypothetical protein [Planctomycetota bacterium]